MSMEEYDDRVAQSYSDDTNEAETTRRHTQFLDLTNGEGGSRPAGFSESEEEEEDDDGDDDAPAPVAPAAAAASSSSTKARASTTSTAVNPNTPGKVVEAGQEHTGRWTREEHAAFLTALKMYGKEWKKVAAKVKTRTVVQTRTHAQKYFQKLQKAINGSESGRVTSVEMGVSSDTKKPQKKKKPTPQPPKPQQRSQSTASTHAATHLMNLSSQIQQQQTPYATTSAAYASSSSSTPAYSSAPMAAAATNYAAHGFSTSTLNNDQPLLPPQALPSFATAATSAGGFFSRDAPFGVSIVAPEPDLRKLPEPSPAACGKRKLAEIAAAQMLAGVAARSSVGGDVTPPPTEPPEPPLARKSTGLSLQIVNPETLGITYDSKRKRGDGSSPTTPWDGQLEALVSERRMKEELLKSSPDDDDAKLSAAPFVHPVCGPASAYGRSMLHRAVCDMNLANVNQLLSRLDIRRRDEAGYCPLHTACALTMIGPSNTTVACDLFQLLVSAGADVCDLDSNGNTPLHWAARAGNERVARLLLLNNCPPDVQNEMGETALHWAMRAGRRGMPVVCLLLDSGALASIVNKQFRRPVDVAVAGFPDEDPKKDSKMKKSNRAGRKKIKAEVLEEIRQVRANLFARSAQSRTLVLHHPECLEHVPKSDTDWEVPDRVNAIMRRIMPDNDEDYTTGIYAQEVTVSSEFDRAKLDLLSRVHSAEYLSFVNDLSKDLERQRREGMEKPQEESKPLPAAVPFTPMVQKKVMNELDYKNIKQADHSDTSFSAGSLRAARRAAGAVQHAVDCVLVGRNRNAFCVVRPPGHHAGIQGLLAGGESCGFCIFNNVAAGALHAISDERALCKRCAVVDLDVHHGNGTEEIVKKCHDPAKLLFFSIHLFDHDKKRARGSPSYGYKFYPGTGDEDDLAHNIINVPIAPLWREQTALPKDAPALPQNTHNTRQKVKMKAASAANSPRSTGDEGSLSETAKASDTESETASRASRKSATSSPAASPRYAKSGRVAYRRAIQDRLLPALRAFNPDLILISAGFDAAKGDVGNARHYIGGKESMGLDLEPEDYAWTTRKVLEIADICCHGRVVSVLEGGYGRTPTQSGDEPRLLDKSVFSECAIRHLQAMIDPYNLEQRFTGS